eukprot:TRINITY_DN8159_c0_g1_i1.p1 TRINITY_DN8159_c0_g1~~TRINITY_DN8159_c0_g1_i1.p1  ORF type:complete len:1551 (-),score=313.16 TRINITY_DN8159_c0_g1_i1:84-4736(-)
MAQDDSSSALAEYFDTVHVRLDRAMAKVDSMRIDDIDRDIQKLSSNLRPRQTPRGERSSGATDYSSAPLTDRESKRTKSISSVSKYPVLAPSSWQKPPQCSAAPPKSLDLSFVIGFQKNESGQNLLHMGEGDVVYYAAAKVIVQDASTRVQRFIHNHDAPVTCIAKHPVLPICASGQAGRHPRICIFNTKTMLVQKTLTKGFTAGIISVGFSADGHYLVVMCGDAQHTLYVYDWAGGDLLCSRRCSREKMFGVVCNQFSHGLFFVAFGPRTLKFWSYNAETKDLAHRRPVYGGAQDMRHETLSAVCYTADSVAVVGTTSGRVYLFRSNELWRYVNAHTGQVHCLTSSHDGVVSGGPNGTVRLWSTGLSLLSEVVVAQDRGINVTALSTVTGGEAVVATDDGEIIALHLHTADTPVTLQHAHMGDCAAVAVHPTIPWFASASADSYIRLFDAGNVCALAGECHLPGPVSSVSFSCDGTQLACGLLSGELVILQSATLELVEHMAGTGVAITVLQFAVGSFLGVGYADGTVVLLDNKFSPVFSAPRTHSAAVQSIDFSVDGAHLQTASAALELLYWTRTGNPVVPDSMRDTEWASWSATIGWPLQGARGKSGEVSTAARSHDLSLLAVGDTDGSVRLLRYPSVFESSHFRKLAGHTGKIAAVAFVADDEYLVSAGGSDTTVMLWKLRDVQQLNDSMSPPSLESRTRSEARGVHLFQQAMEQQVAFSLSQAAEAERLRNSVVTPHITTEAARMGVHARFGSLPEVRDAAHYSDLLYIEGQKQSAHRKQLYKAELERQEQLARNDPELTFKPKITKNKGIRTPAGVVFDRLYKVPVAPSQSLNDSISPSRGDPLTTPRQVSSARNISSAGHTPAVPRTRGRTNDDGALLSPRNLTSPRDLVSPRSLVSPRGGSTIQRQHSPQRDRSPLRNETPKKQPSVSPAPAPTTLVSPRRAAPHVPPLPLPSPRGSKPSPRPSVARVDSGKRSMPPKPSSAGPKPQPGATAATSDKKIRGATVKQFGDGSVDVVVDSVLPVVRSVASSGANLRSLEDFPAIPVAAFEDSTVTPSAITVVTADAASANAAASARHPQAVTVTKSLSPVPSSGDASLTKSPGRSSIVSFDRRISSKHSSITAEGKPQPLLRVDTAESALSMPSAPASGVTVIKAGSTDALVARRQSAQGKQKRSISKAPHRVSEVPQLNGKWSVENEKQILQLLAAGCNVNKYSFAAGAPDKRMISFDARGLLMGSAGKRPDQLKLVAALDTIRYCVFGDFTRVFQEMAAIRLAKKGLSLPPAWHCVSVICKTRSYDFEFSNEKDAETWVLGLQAHLRKNFTENDRLLLSASQVHFKRIRMKLDASWCAHQRVWTDTLAARILDAARARGSFLQVQTDTTIGASVVMLHPDVMGRLEVHPGDVVAVSTVHSRGSPPTKSTILVAIGNATIPTTRVSLPAVACANIAVRGGDDVVLKPTTVPYAERVSVKCENNSGVPEALLHAACLRYFQDEFRPIKTGDLFAVPCGSIGGTSNVVAMFRVTSATPSLSIVTTSTAVDVRLDM